MKENGEGDWRMKKEAEEKKMQDRKSFRCVLVNCYKVEGQNTQFQNFKISKFKQLQMRTKRHKIRNVIG